MHSIGVRASFPAAAVPPGRGAAAPWPTVGVKDSTSGGTSVTGGISQTPYRWGRGQAHPGSSHPRLPPPVLSSSRGEIPRDPARPREIPCDRASAAARAAAPQAARAPGSLSRSSAQHGPHPAPHPSTILSLQGKVSPVYSFILLKFRTTDCEFLRGLPSSPSCVPSVGHQCLHLLCTPRPVLLGRPCGLISCKASDA